MTDATTILDRTGRKISADLIRKANSLAGNVTRTTIPGLFDVRSGLATYRIAIDGGLTLCTCDARTTLCSHVLAVWLHCYTTGDKIHVAAIDGPNLTTVPDHDDDESDPFDGLG